MSPAVRRLSTMLICVLVAGCTSTTDQADTSVGTSAPILTTTASSPGPQASTTTTTPSTTSTTPVTTTTLPLDVVRANARLEVVATGHDAPVLLVANPDRTSTQDAPDIVVEQPGRIVTVGERRVLLDITNDVIFGGEQGLLGLAYHPDFDENRLAYVNYVGTGRRTIVEQFSVNADGTFDLGSRRVILAVDQPAPNHNGGMLAFGPDGYLWIGMGDGGGSNDRFGNAQRTDTLLGAMLRIAVGVAGVDEYGIPPDNPYADGVAGAPEIWAIGLRNPWRFTFDDGMVWIADVGQNEIEEVDVAGADEAGLNYGWPLMEGTRCTSSSCMESAVDPVVEYDHSEGCSITGGHVYRGDAIPTIDGQYFYADYCSGLFRSWSVGTGTIDWTDTVGPIPGATGFGVGGDGELYITTQGGTIHRLSCCASTP